MTLVELLQEEGFELPEIKKPKDPGREAFIGWLSKKVFTLMKQDGAFFPHYQMRLLGGYFHEQGVLRPGREIPKTYVEANKPLRNELRRLRCKEKPFKWIYSHILGRQVRFRPGSITHAHLWWQTEKGLNKYLSKIVERETTEEGLTFVTLAEPFFSVVNNVTATSAGDIIHGYS